MNTATISETATSARSRSRARKADLNASTANSPAIVETPKTNPELDSLKDQIAEAIQTEVIDPLVQTVTEVIVEVVAETTHQPMDATSQAIADKIAELKASSGGTADRKEREPKDKKLAALQFIAAGWDAGLTRAKIVEGLASHMSITAANAAYYVDRVAPKPEKRVLGNTTVAETVVEAHSDDDQDEGEAGAPEEPSSESLVGDTEGEQAEESDEVVTEA